MNLKIEKLLIFAFLFPEEDVNGVNGVQVDIDASWFDDADYVLLVPDLTFSASDSG